MEFKIKADPSLANKELSLYFAFDNETVPLYDIKKVRLDSNGTASVKTRIGSNKVEKYISPVRFCWFWNFS